MQGDLHYVSSSMLERWFSEFLSLRSSKFLWASRNIRGDICKVERSSSCILLHWESSCKASSAVATLARFFWAAGSPCLRGSQPACNNSSPLGLLQLPQIPGQCVQLLRQQQHLLFQFLSGLFFDFLTIGPAMCLVPWWRAAASPQQYWWWDLVVARDQHGFQSLSWVQSYLVPHQLHHLSFPMVRPADFKPSSQCRKTGSYKLFNQRLLTCTAKFLG